MIQHDARTHEGFCLLLGEKAGADKVDNIKYEVTFSAAFAWTVLFRRVVYGADATWETQRTKVTFGPEGYSVTKPGDSNPSGTVFPVHKGADAVKYAISVSSTT